MSNYLKEACELAEEFVAKPNASDVIDEHLGQAGEDE
jgi:hypothetical protein